MIWDKVKNILGDAIDITAEQITQANQERQRRVSDQLRAESVVEVNRQGSGFKPSPRIDTEIRFGIMRSQQGRCHYGDGILKGWNRGRKGFTFEIDHKTPKSQGGEDHLQNLVACCRKHNLEKGVLNYDDYQRILKQNPSLRRCGEAEYGKPN